jgi:structural maintenance of chromosome 3 (chondroitin sulfate proteoglycan 6)
MCRDLWREDGKLGQTVNNAKEQMQTAERNLAGMMDKVR